MNFIMQNGNKIEYSEDAIIMNGVCISKPPKYKMKNVAIIGDRLFVDGYEYIDCVWKRTLKALFYKWF